MIYTNEMIKEKNKQKLKIQKVLKCLSIPVIVFILIISLYISYQKYIKKSTNIDLFGFKFYTVLTGSMEPEFNIGDLIIERKIEQEDIHVGDIITYSLNNQNTVTHRVIKISQENGEILYETKGDNNNSPDEKLVKYSQIQGHIVFKIDKLGKIITEFVSGIGMVVLLVIIIISYIHSSRSEEKRIAREDARRRYNIPKYKKEKTI